ncbi:hypothetical protein, partial [Clavibacter michiganensis]|uniref:hypothetical protein n=2 Tax=Clavibacter michiganensis TaxID=28447 RepID=UPI0019D3C206
MRAGAARRAGGIVTFVLLEGGMRAGSRRPARAGAREIGIRIMGRGAAPCMNGMFCFRELATGGRRSADR